MWRVGNGEVEAGCSIKEGGQIGFIEKTWWKDVRELVLWPQRQLEVFSKVHRSQGGWSGVRKEGRWGGGQTSAGCRLWAEQSSAPGP